MRCETLSVWRVAAAVGLAVCTAGCWAGGYGETVDRSTFVSARVNDAGIVLYTAQDLAYRPAAGWRAFPDGGIPRYLRDRNVIGRVDPATGRAEVLHAKKNTEWQNGQGQLNIHDFKGEVAVVVESGQRRSDYLTDVHYYLLRLSGSRLTPMPLKQDLQARGRDVGYFYLLDSHGTLLFVTSPLGSRKVETPTNELWLRRPSGEYLLVARHADYYGESAGELIYWQLDDRALRAFDLGGGSTRALARYVPPPDVRLEVGVAIGAAGRSLELRRRAGEAWHTEKTLLTVDKAK